MRVANRYRIICSLMIPLLLAPGACSRAAPWRDEAVGQGVRLEDAPWPFWPQRMRIHPLSRIVLDPAGGDHIEAHLEFRDGDGHTTRAVGAIRIDLFGQNGSREMISLLEWNVSLSDLEANNLYYDDVMRTYSFRLNLGGENLPSRPLLIARFMSDDGLLFENRLVLRTADNRSAPVPEPASGPDDQADSDRGSGSITEY